MQNINVGYNTKDFFYVNAIDSGDMPTKETCIKILNSTYDKNLCEEDQSFVDNRQECLDRKLCENKGLKAYYSEITDLKVRNNSADAIICIATFHHLSTYDNRIKALKELKRVVKPNGKIMLSVWAKEQPKKTRITFENYGDNIVYWKKKYPRYYYIFELEEIKLLFNEVELNIDKEFYDCGNNVFILSKKI